MYERMLNKRQEPTIAQMSDYCGACANLFTKLNEWLSKNYKTVQKVTFPYGNHYGWGIAHKKSQKLICNIFAENNAFTVMIRLSSKQFESVYNQLHQYTKDYIDNKYPCGNGGWIQYRITCKEHLDDIQQLLSVKCS